MRAWRPHPALLVVVLAATLGCAAQAQESAKPEAAPEMSNWMWVNFALLVAGLGYLIYKHAPGVFRARDQEIRRGIDEAAANRRDAEAGAAEIDRRLAGFEAEIEKLRAGVMAEMAAETERLRHETERMVGRMEEQARQEIGFLTKAAGQELKAYSADLALQLAGQRIEQRMTGDTQHQLTREFIDGLRHVGAARN